MERIKRHIKRFGANLEARLQVLGMLLGFLLPYILWPGLMTFMENAGLEKNDFSDDKAKLGYLVLQWLGEDGKGIFGFLIAGALLVLFRKRNKETMFNKGGNYKDHAYWWYFVCAKVLGYSKCSMERVPIPTQFQLIQRETFNEYVFGDIPEENVEIGQCWLKSLNANDKEVNLIISDTYPLQLRNLPESKRSFATVKVYRIDESDHRRLYIKALVDNIINVVKNLPEIEKLNIFATTNPKNTYEIASKVFNSGGRNNIQKIQVFYQDEKDWMFKEKHILSS